MQRFAAYVVLLCSLCLARKSKKSVDKHTVARPYPQTEARPKILDDCEQAQISFPNPGGIALSAKRNADDRQEFFNQANARMVRGIDSHANFAMLKTGRMAVDVIEHFKKNNVLIARLFPSMNTYVRVSFGTPPEIKEFWRVWDLMPPGKMEM